MRRFRRKVCLVLLLVAGAGAEEGPRGTASLEELLQVKVSTVGKRQQRLNRAAAAVFVISREDIRRSGATSIPEVLRLAPGVHVARVTGSTWAVTIRGFNGIFSNKLLVLVDGQTVYNPLFSGVWWHLQDPPLEDIEQIEVVRGPAAAVWGANAVNGVINIITRRADQTRGTLLRASGGTPDVALTHLRHGGLAGKYGSYRVFTTTAARRQWAPEAQLSDAHWGTAQAGFRGDWSLPRNQEFTIQAGLIRSFGTQFQSTAFPVSLPGSNQRADFTSSSANLLGRWVWNHASGAQTSVQGWLNSLETHYNGLIPRTRSGDVEFQHQRQVKTRHLVSFGAGFRRTLDNVWGNTLVRFHPGKDHYGMVGFSLVDDIELVRDKLFLSAGGRLEHNTFAGWNLQPTARALWALGPKHAIWVARARAVRVPSRGELGVEWLFPATGLQLVGNRSFRSEHVDSWETGFRTELHARLQFDVALFHNTYDDLRSGNVEPSGAPPAPLAPNPLLVRDFLGNLLRGRGKGVEVAAAVDVTRRWRLKGSWTGLWLNVGPQNPEQTGFVAMNFESRTPRHQFQVQSLYQITRQLQFDTWLYRHGTMPELKDTGFQLPALGYTRLDCRLGWLVSESLEISVGGSNLLKPRHYEFFIQPGVEVTPVARGVYVRLTRRF